MSFLDVFFPKHCVACRKLGSYFCDICFSKISFTDISNCLVCERRSIDGLTHPACRSRYAIDGVFSSVLYAGITKKAVYSFKYKPYLTDLRHVLSELFYEGIIQKEQLMKHLTPETVLVPVPLHKTRLRNRGFNQAVLLSHGVGKKLDLPVVDVLERVKNTHTQFNLPKAERKENIKGAFQVKKLDKLPKQVLLIDDIVTSGATLREAATVLKRAGVKRVWGVTLAHGE